MLVLGQPATNGKCMPTKFSRMTNVHVRLTDVLRTKGKKLQIGAADRTPRETLEERLEETPSNARCFAQGSSLMC